MVVEQHRKKTLMKSTNILKLNDNRRTSCMCNEKKVTANHIDFLWMASNFLYQVVPMWVGWNAMYTATNEHNVMKVWYLPQINESPTSNAVVLETMRRAQRIAAECGKNEMNVTMI